MNKINPPDISQNAFQNLIPKDSTVVRKVMQQGAKCSLSSNIIKAHLFSTACTVAAIALSILSIPAYAIRGICEFSVRLLTFQISSAFIFLATNMLNAGKSLLFVTVGVSYVAVGLFFPKKIYPYVSPKEGSVQEITEVLNKQLIASRQRELSALGKITDLKKKLKASQKNLKQLERLDADFQKLKKDKQKIEEELQQLQDEAVDAQSSLESLQQDKDSAEERFHAAQLAHQAAAAIFQRDRTTFDASLKEKEGLEKQLVQLQGANAAPLEALRKEKEALQKQLEQLQGAYAVPLEASRKAREGLEKQLEQAQGSHKTALDALRKEKEGIEKTLEQAQGVHKTALDALRKEKEAVEKQLEQVQGTHKIALDALQKEKQEINKDFQHAQGVVKKLQEDRIRTLNDLEEVSSEFDRNDAAHKFAMKEQKQAFENFYKEAQASLGTLRGSLDTVNAKAFALEQARSKAEKELAQVKKQLEDQNSNNSRLDLLHKAAVQKQKEDFAAFSLAIQRKDKTTEAILADQERLKKENDHLLAQVQQLTEEAAKAKREQEKLSQLAQRLLTSKEGNNPLIGPSTSIVGQSNRSFQPVQKDDAAALSPPPRFSVDVESQFKKGFVFPPAPPRVHSPDELKVRDESPPPSPVLQASASEKEKAADSASSKQKKSLIDHPSAVHKYALMLKEYNQALGEQHLKQKLHDLEAHTKSMSVEQMGMFLPLKRLLHVMLNPVDPQGQYKNARDRYQNHFIVELRNVIASPDYDKIRHTPRATLSKQNRQWRDLIRNICHVRWARVDIYEYLKGVLDITEARSKADNNEKLSAETFSKTVDSTNKCVHRMKPQLALWGQQFVGEVGLKDYTASENTPFVRGYTSYTNKSGKAKKVIYLRHGSPTTKGAIANIMTRMGIELVNKVVVGAVNGGIELVNKGMSAIGSNKKIPIFSQIPKLSSGEAIAPDYLEFVLAARDRKEGILYCVHQRLNDEGFVGESVRVAAIRALQEGNPNFHALVQSVDGDLFLKKSEQMQGVGTFDGLKAMILREFNPANDRKTCALPKVLESKDQIEAYYGTVMPKLLNEVHRIFFNNRTNIAVEKEGKPNLDEWQTFILIFYVFQKIDLKFRLESISKDYSIKHYTTACKDFLDRGGCMALVEDRLHDYWLGQENNSQVLEERLVNILAPPILVKKKHVLVERLHPALVVDQFLFNLPEAQKKAWRDCCFEGWKCSGVEVIKKHDQTNW